MYHRINATCSVVRSFLLVRRCWYQRSDLPGHLPFVTFAFKVTMKGSSVTQSIVGFLLQRFYAPFTTYMLSWIIFEVFPAVERPRNLQLVGFTSTGDGMCFFSQEHKSIEIISLLVRTARVARINISFRRVAEIGTVLKYWNSQVFSSQAYHDTLFRRI